MALMALCAGLVMPHSKATSLPDGVVSHLREGDSGVSVRFDGVVTLSNGEVYLPVLPQRDLTNQPPKALTITPLADLPDLIEYSNGVYLIRVIRTTSGKLALAKIDPYPIGLKEGLLPQDLLLPASLYIPAELKVILGNLPYNPMPRPEGTTLPAADIFSPKPVVAENASQPSPNEDSARVVDYPDNTLIATQLNKQRLVRYQLRQPTEDGELPALVKKASTKLDCLPITLHLASDNSHVAAPCLNTSEVVIADLETHSVQTRLPVKAPIAHSISDGRLLWLTHRTKNTITVIDLTQRQIVGMIEPGIRGYALAVDDLYLYIGDAAEPNVAVWDRKRKAVVKTMPGLPGMVALTLKPVKHTPLLWVASRTKHQVAPVNLATGQLVRTMDVAKKPVSFTHHHSHPNVVWVVTGGGHQVQQITENGDAKLWATLPGGSFPNQMVFLDSETALLTAVGGQQAYLVGMGNHNAGQLVPLGLSAKSNAIVPVLQAGSE